MVTAHAQWRPRDAPLPLSPLYYAPIVPQVERLRCADNTHSSLRQLKLKDFVRRGRGTESIFFRFDGIGQILNIWSHCTHIFRLDIKSISLQNTVAFEEATETRAHGEGRRSRQQYQDDVCPPNSN